MPKAACSRPTSPCPKRGPPRRSRFATAGRYAPTPSRTPGLMRRRCCRPRPPWVDAGDALPRGADAVLPPDAVTGAEVHAGAAAGDGVLAAGADAAAGQILRRAGERLRAVDVAALQSAGVARVSIREPRVRVVSVGADQRCTRRRARRFGARQQRDLRACARARTRGRTHRYRHHHRRNRRRRERCQCRHA